MLLRSMTAHLEQQFPQHPALVIPTESARRTLASVGWQTRRCPGAARLRPGPGPLRATMAAQRDPGKVRGALRPCAPNGVWVRRHVPRSGTLHLSDTMEDALLRFAQRLPPRVRASCATSARSSWSGATPSTLAHALHSRPSGASGEIRGFLVFEATSSRARVRSMTWSVRLRRTCAQCWPCSSCAALPLQVWPTLQDTSRRAAPGTRTAAPARIHRPRCGCGVPGAGWSQRRRLAWHLTQGDKDI